MEIKVPQFIVAGIEATLPPVLVTAAVMGGGALAGYEAEVHADRGAQEQAISNTDNTSATAAAARNDYHTAYKQEKASRQAGDQASHDQNTQALLEWTAGASGLASIVAVYGAARVIPIRYAKRRKAKK